MMYDNVDVVAVVDDDDYDDDDDDDGCSCSSYESFDCLKSMIICYRLVFSNWVNDSVRTWTSSQPVG
jgi:hypothetical protein